ncbi:MAG TPA: 30S ribosomal protein S6 [Kiritimatiellia bacterium]|jgi:small subunit ribosomal protein S6|nr:MAG: 30S ribosomal protein S6 [Verrucomicrobia bacterium ADurb.Bin070]HPB11050.1 30S ribosomal protein S6 [Kiritimatiellia bacterium]HPO37068.1 30S ribosomal protein S6 [Kiritimatiellia bacterium]HQL51291.1 30S ribosomal protein S6 [Kiritimatiellia bacterium]HQQ91993.1 30S ribosomal protein S6 [Kiritimatiellia bacterium]
MKKYDGLYIFAGSAKDDVLDKQIDKVRGEITRLSGNVLTTEVLGKRTFARPMQKRDNGVYVKIRFELDPNHITTLLGRYHLAEDVFRVQILAVDERRESVLARQAEERKAREVARAEAEAAANENKSTQGEA